MCRAFLFNSHNHHLVYVEDDGCFYFGFKGNIHSLMMYYKVFTDVIYHFGFRFEV
ncbi:UNVERIFIED_ORG: hypothetical protein ABIC81_002830 [Bacillus proteolyticus]|nr:hypothetical protein IEI_03390 [Bacillus wiedmannii]